MQLTLYVPGLLLPDAIRADSVFGLSAPIVSLLLGRAEQSELPSDWLASAFGIASPLPAATFRKVGAGETAQGDWICLDPVHLQVAREGIALADPTQLHLSADESAALIDAVQPLFAAWGEISSTSPTRWELKLNRSVALETCPLPNAIAQPVDPALPGGAEGRQWRQLLSEVQTLLHAHPVNQARAAVAKPTVNSLWPWGNGCLPEHIQANFNVVWSDDPVVAGLCAHAGVPCLITPEKFQLASGRVLACVDLLERPARHFDALAWRENLLALEQDWLAPAIAAVKKGACSELRLIGTCVHGQPATSAFTITRRALWRFWRRPLPLTALKTRA